VDAVAGDDLFKRLGLFGAGGQGGLQEALGGSGTARQGQNGAFRR